ncbi:hypothetical protein CAMGR0001_2396 [Campylobacter gracilis RM3268]|uniref:Uncharacterized protein n=1 Tax=Campylobacter gracilis RM3268 TaxID=553220 RepID=C8PE45_9BACT|nr:hypothetical protein CAMGR0001_2396 [Campylobacter gracilis RM3268]
MAAKTAGKFGGKASAQIYPQPRETTQAPRKFNLVSVKMLGLWQHQI